MKSGVVCWGVEGLRIGCWELKEEGRQPSNPPSPPIHPPWSCLASWNFSSDPCSLPRRTHFLCGLSCDPSSHRVTHLLLDPAGYSAPISPLLSLLSHLTHLSLSDNSFHGPFPPSLLSHLPLLQSLSLRSNSLSGPLPVSLSLLPSLQTLDLSHNSFSGPLPILNNLTLLKLVDLSYNILSGSIANLPPNLSVLAIKANKLSGSLPFSSFQGLNQLKVVELSDNMFGGVLQSWFFSSLVSLQQVNLANNSFSRLEIWGSGVDSNLVAVDLGFNQIEGLLPANFTRFPSLSSLSLRFNKFIGPIPWQFGNKASLRRLFLDGNFLNGTAPEGFFSNKSEVLGSFGDNCLEKCPTSSQLCATPQKPSSVCQKAYGRKSRTF
ncbi:hypothetical protein Syun_015196 [Stephania yunnanensis]|uniref:Uncharacterized protein n=1 Tax=Stephania yunnanensis TaxID=152371 RepID=A0AAP0PCL2_9MAGN